MPKKRSRAYKQKQQKVRASITQSLAVVVPQNKSVSDHLVQVESTSHRLEPIRSRTLLPDLIGYDQKLIWRDLRKSALLSLLLIAVLIGIFLYTKSN